MTDGHKQIPGGLLQSGGPVLQSVWEEGSSFVFLGSLADYPLQIDRPGAANETG